MAGRRRSERALRDKLRSPGRPPVARREHRRRFWSLIAAGLSSEDAAMTVGLSQPVGFRWFRTAGGMAPSHLSPSSKPTSGRYLSFGEREEIALLRAEGFGVREVACRLGRAPSTISRDWTQGRPIGAMRQHAAAIWITGRRRLSGTRSGQRVALKRQSLQRTRRCDPMCRIGLRVPFSPLVVLRLPRRKCLGKVDGTGDAGAGDGVWHGARSRSLSGCGATTRMTRRCALAMRRFTRRSTCRAEAH
jgi:hypothetical protein